MAYHGKIITNPKTGQQIRFIRTSKETEGGLLEMESIFQPNAKEPVPHYHPLQTEDFTILEGEVTVRINCKIRILKQGDTLHLSRRTVHSMWNNTAQRAVVNWKVQPALETEYFFETGMGLASSTKTNELGMPGILQIAFIDNKFSNVYRLARPSFFIQKILFAVLTPLAYLAGYKPYYKKYID
jgi:quercetin dioxygenase-like cupin family protein